ncbi:MAG: hypothetical protein KAV87_01265 [Desulfobacteraceae bacterium]|nr:hypothetical protein [Desulfobacteraceae bacterium]
MITLPRKGKPLTNSFGIALPFLLIAAQFFLSTPAYADNIEDIYKKLKKELPKEDQEWKEKFNMIEKYIEKLNKTDKELQQLNLSVEAGFDGHRAGEENLYKLNSEIEIAKGVYPSAFRFRAGTSVQLKNNDWQEEVTSLMVNYDYHFKPWLEVYGFVERFSDSYLSIKHRYEVGGGIMTELDFFGTTKKISEKWDKDLNTYEDISREAHKGYRSYLKKLDESSTDKEPTIKTRLLRKQLCDLKKEEKRIKQTFNKKQARLSVGMALTIFSELEKVEIEKKFVDESIPEEKEPFSLDGEQRFRIVLRPSVVFRPTKTLTLRMLKYYKHPLGSPIKGEWDGKRDYRTDALIRAELKLPVTPKWAKNVLLVFEYKRHYDNLPLEVPKPIVDDYKDKGMELLKWRAENMHEQFKFKLKILF